MDTVIGNERRMLAALPKQGMQTLVEQVQARLLDPRTAAEQLLGG